MSLVHLICSEISSIGSQLNSIFFQEMHLNDLNVRKSNKIIIAAFSLFHNGTWYNIKTQNYILHFHEKSVKREQLGYKFLKTLYQPESAQNSSFLTNMIYCNRGF